MFGLRALPRSLRCSTKSRCYLKEGTVQRIPVVQRWNYRDLMRSGCVLGADPIKLLMPALSPTMTEGTIAKWLKKEGESVSAGDALCEVETDKATVTMDADEDGILAKILVQEGTSNIAINTLIAVMVEEGEDYKNVEIPSETDAEPTTDTPTAKAEAVEQKDGEQSGTEISSHRNMISPAVRNLLDTHDLNANDIPSTGPSGILLKGDVLKFIESGGLKASATAQTERPAASPPPPVTPVPQPTVHQPQETFIDTPLTGMRRTIAKRLTESKTTIPHAYASIDCTMDEVARLRKQLKKENVKVSVNDFIIKAVAVALQEIPEVNATWKNDKRELLNEVDISVAVATESGLITPIVRDASHLGLNGISEKVRELAVKAREGKLKPDEYQGGCFTVSNLGMFGISEFTAVINPPQSCIMAIGGSKMRLNSQRKPSSYMTVQMSSDARVVDNALACQFLTAFKKNIENPMRLGLL